MSLLSILSQMKIRQDMDVVHFLLGLKSEFEPARDRFYARWPSFPSFPWKNIWRFKAPTRVAFFICSIALGKILTHDNLCKKNVIVME
jgi:hypothetical protein